MALDTVIMLKGAQIFQRDHLILADVNLHLEKGEFVYLIGKTGSGKSSLLQTLYAELPLKEGEGMIAGVDLRKLKKKDIPFLRRKIGIVFQDFQLLYDRNVEQNLQFVLKATGWKNKVEIQTRIDDVLQKTGLQTKKHKMPHQLSGGEQQRLGIARALINDPDLILADEPSGNLDPETTAEILQLLLEICKAGRTVLVATHDYSLFELHHARTLKCDQGKILDSNLL
ncbi:MAG: ATP-binding cassette domain-containing protein [Bacteroidia bacterium]|nr:ATP-binding cassette domain-containing protein [Bacteroidia bacterium]MCC6768149.1 ATP-binding cassette domain-containing protein [Bacteroidia bacterium]